MHVPHRFPKLEFVINSFKMILVFFFLIKSFNYHMKSLDEMIGKMFVPLLASMLIQLVQRHFFLRWVASKATRLDATATTVASFVVISPSCSIFTPKWSSSIFHKLNLRWSVRCTVHSKLQFAQFFMRGVTQCSGMPNNSCLRTWIVEFSQKVKVLKER